MTAEAPESPRKVDDVNIQTTSNAAAWYQDPTNPQLQRFWDGAAWTEHVRPVMTPAFPVGQPAASNAFSVSAMILGALAFIIFPPLFGTVGMILGAVGMSRREPKAGLGMAVAGAGLVLGMLLGMIVVSSSMA